MKESVPDIPSELLFEEVPIYISVQDRDCKILKANKKFKDTFGDRQGDYCYAVFKQREDKCPVCPMDSTFEDGRVHKSEEIVFSPEGLPVHVLVNTSPIYNDKGEIVAVMEIATDITENKRLQRKLEENSENYRILFNTVPCFISIQDRRLRVIDANDKFKYEFGFLRYNYCYELYKKRTERCEICPVVQTFEDGKVHSSEEIVTTKNGELMNVLVIAAPLHDSLGNVTEVMEMSTDITSIKAMQNQMANVGTLVASLAHTIKGIITGLDGGMYVVDSGFKANKEELIKKGWQMVQRNVERVSHLVLDMLYYAKNREPEKQNIFISDFISEIKELYQKKFDDNKIEIVLNVECKGEIIGDPKSIYTLILTLVENAIDACRWEKEKRNYQITIDLNEDSDNVFLSIKDTGLGIPDEVKDKLFTVMYSTKGSSGSGFGLMVVKKIVDEHNGSIKVESEVGKGSCFSVTLPKK